MAQKEYAQRDTEALGEHYIRHVEAMTAENLHDKSAIAAELAHRDAQIAKDTEVYVLVERGRFQGVFATSDAAKKEYALHVKQAFGVDELKWRESDGSWLLSSECKLGEVSVLKRRVLKE